MKKKGKIFMIIFTWTILIYSIISLICCFTFSIYGNIFPNKIVSGMKGAAICSILTLLCVVIPIILDIIYLVIFRKQIADFPPFKTYQVIIIGVMLVYFLYRLGYSAIYGSTVGEASKISAGTMGFLAGGIILNFVAIIYAINILKMINV